MVIKSLEIKKQFIAECKRRMRSILEMHSDENIFSKNESYYNYIHQQFDSLVSASRAINFAEFEFVSRAAGSFARHLRNKLPQESSTSEENLLLNTVGLTLECCESLNNSLELDQELIQNLLDAEARLSEQMK